MVKHLHIDYVKKMNETPTLKSTKIRGLETDTVNNGDMLKIIYDKF